MKKLITLVASLLTISCGLNETVTRDPWTPGSGESCVSVAVDNQNFYDVRIHHIPTHQRLGTVTGLSTGTLALCDFGGATEGTFRLHLIGGSGDMIVQTHGKLRANQNVLINIAPRFQSSMIFGNVQGRSLGGEEGGLSIFGMQRVHPNGMHLGILLDVAGCTGDGVVPNPETHVMWAVADSIFDGQGHIPYGAYIADEFALPTIIIDKAYWTHPTVISHEILHLLGYEEEDEILDRCVVGVSPGPLVKRYR